MIKRLIFDFSSTGVRDGWQVQQDSNGKIFVYTSLSKAIVATWQNRVFYPKPHKARGLKEFRLIFEFEDKT